MLNAASNRGRPIFGATSIRRNTVYIMICSAYNDYIDNSKTSSLQCQMGVKKQICVNMSISEHVFRT